MDPLNATTPGLSYSNYPPELQQEAAQLARRRAITDLMLSRAIQPMQQDHIRGFGGVSIPIPTSPLAALTNAAGTYIAGKSLGDVDAASMALSQRYQGMLSDRIKSYVDRLKSGDSQGAAELAVSSGFPQLQSMGLKSLEKSSEPFILREGARRYGPGGNVTAENPFTVHPGTVYTQDQENKRAELGRDVHERVAQLGRESAEERARLDRGTRMTIANMVDTRQRQLYGLMEGGFDQEVMRPTAELIAGGRMEPPHLNNLRSPMALQNYSRLIGLVKDINPDFDAKDWNASKTALSYYSSGAGGQATASASKLANHFKTIEQLAGALQNSDLPAFNRAANYMSTQSGRPAPGNFDAAKTIVGDELVKFLVGSKSGEGERQKAQELMANWKSPEQTAGVLATMRELIGGQLYAHANQYAASTKRAPETLPGLSDEARNLFMKKAGAIQGTSGLSPTSTAPATRAGISPTNAKGWRLMRDSKGNQAYVSPDGKSFEEIK